MLRGTHRCEGWRVASTPCERIKSWNCLLDAAEKGLLTGAQGLEDVELNCTKMNLWKALGYFSSNKGSSGLLHLLENPLDFSLDVKKKKKKESFCFFFMFLYKILRNFWWAIKMQKTQKFKKKSQQNLCFSCSERNSAEGGTAGGKEQAAGCQ